jgi:hypothetical protein
VVVLNELSMHVLDVQAVLLSVAVASPNAAMIANIISVVFVFIVIVENTRVRYKYINTFI